jgi:UDP-GlcNAc3NAcA epimerase
LPQLGVTPRNYILATVHRAENTDDPTALRNIARALNKIETPILFPVHPRTRAALERYGITWQSHVRCIEPVGFTDMLALEANARRILTDSGGVQKEAFLLEVPCITLREETEWRETVEAGWNVLVGSRWEAIVEASAFPRPDPPHQHPFGNGDAARRIALSLSNVKVEADQYVHTLKNETL